MNTPISENVPAAEDSALEEPPARLLRKRASDSWARELPAPLPPAEVEAACRELLSVPVRERREVLHRRAGEHGAAGRIQIVAALVERGYAYRHSDPHAYLRIAQVASQCAYRYLCAPLELRPAGRQLRAGALGFLANAYRIVGKLRQAGRIWERLAPEEEGNPVLAGRLFRFRAALARDSRRFAEAVDNLNRALSCFEEGGARHEAAQAGLVLAKTHEDAGDVDAALLALAAALPRIDGRRHPDLAAVAFKNLALLLTEKGELHAAALVLDRIRKRFEALELPMVRLRARWCQGRLLREMGDLAGAVEVFGEVKDAFVAREINYDAALAGLELAQILARQHDSVAVMRLARELYPVFVAHDIPREARMALVQFYRAAEDLRADAALITRTLEQLKEIARRPADAPNSPTELPAAP